MGPTTTRKLVFLLDTTGRTDRWTSYRKSVESGRNLQPTGLQMRFWLACSVFFFPLKEISICCQHLKIEKFHIKTQIPSFF